MTLSIKALSAAAAAAALALGACSSSGDKPAPVIADAIKAQQEQRARADRVLAQAEELTAAGRVDAAIDTYKQAVSIDPKRWEAWYNLGALCNRQGRYAEAVEAWRVAAELPPRDARAYTALGIQYQDLGFLPDASECYNRALERDPNYLPALKKSIQVDQLNDSYTDVTLGRINRALLQETDPKWGEYLQRMKLKTQERVSRAGGNTGH